MSIKYIICNKIKTPDGTVLESRSVHDYRTHRDANGFTYAVDGGTEYLKRTFSSGAPEYIEQSIYSDAPHEIIRENFKWGSYGKDGNEKLHHILLCDMTDAHIEAVIKTQPLKEHMVSIFLEELRYRDQHDLHIND